MSRLGLPAGGPGDPAGDTPERLEGIVPTLHHEPSGLRRRAAASLRTPSSLPPFVPLLRSSCPRAPRPRSATLPGIFLGPEYHFDLARPGAAVYGVNPTPGAAESGPSGGRIEGRESCRFVQLTPPRALAMVRRTAPPGRLELPQLLWAMRMATCARSLRVGARAWINGHEVPVVGRISMDLISFGRYRDSAGMPLQSGREWWISLAHNTESTTWRAKPGRSATKSSPALGKPLSPELIWADS